MSIQQIRSLLEEMQLHGSFQLYGIDHVQTRREDRYSCCQLLLEPSTLLSEYFSRVCQGKLARYLARAEGVVDYVDEFSTSYIQRLPLDRGPGAPPPAGPQATDAAPLSPIQEQLDKLYDAVQHSADPYEAPRLAGQMKAFLLVGTCPDGCGGTRTAYFITVRSPFVAMRHRLFYQDGAYREDRGAFLTLTEHFDLILTGQTCYAFTDRVEALFSLERSFQKKCGGSVEHILSRAIVSDPARFQAFAHRGFTPRKFLGFRPDLLEKMVADRAYRSKVCANFQIGLTPTGEIDTTSDVSSLHFIRLICGRGKQDPFDDSPCAVPFSTPWS